MLSRSKGKSSEAPCVRVVRHSAKWLSAIATRRTMLLGMAIGAVGQKARVTHADSENPELELIAQLPEVPNGSKVSLWRITLLKEQIWEVAYRGPAVAMVESGTMTASKEFPVVGAPPDNEVGPFVGPNGPDFTPGWGIYARDGDLGRLSNRYDPELVISILTAVPRVP